MKRDLVALAVGGLLLLNAIATRAEAADDLLVTVQCHKTRLVLGEPLFLTGSVKNKGQKPVRLAHLDGPAYATGGAGSGLARVLVGKAGEKGAAWSADMIWARSMPTSLPPGAEIVAEYVVSWSRLRGPAFPVPGPYSVSLEFMTESGQALRAEPIPISVQEPRGRDATLWKSLSGTPQYGMLMQVPWMLSKDAQTTSALTALLEQSDGTVYRQYLALQLGRASIAGEAKNRGQAQSLLESAVKAADSAMVRDIATHEVTQLGKSKEVEPESVRLERRKAEIRDGTARGAGLKSGQPLQPTPVAPGEGGS